MDTHLSEQLMLDFAARTGFAGGERIPVRYLWTDSFAVCNFLGLFAERHEEQARVLALRLVDQVHHVLGRHRGDDGRRGWISGLDEARGEKHPTIGGLRIGKPLPEQRAGEPGDAALDWERDGQYFHYLTKWMHALDGVSRVSRDPTYHRWAVELARTAHARFVYRPSAAAPQRMYWKMSIDLSRPQVASMGHHDPLDGLVTFTQLRAHGGGDPALDLDAEIADFAALCAGASWVTDDALGIGGLLTDAYKLAQLAAAGHAVSLALLENLLWSAARSIDLLTPGQPFAHPAEHRLAFRELGLSLGLHAARSIRDLLERLPGTSAARERLGGALRALAGHEHFGDEIEAFWSEPARRESRGWTAHRDINEVMLATRLAPDGYLRIDG